MQEFGKGNFPQRLNWWAKMTNYDQDTNKDGVIDERDDYDKDGDTDEEDEAKRKLEEEAAKGQSDEETEEEKARKAAIKFLQRYGVTPDFVMPPREVRPSATKIDQAYGAMGNLLVDRAWQYVYTDIAGNPTPGIPQGLYDLDLDAAKYLQAMGPDMRFKVTNLLYAKGFYRGSKPTGNRMDFNVDIPAVGRALQLANETGRTIDVILHHIQYNMATIHGITKAPSVKLTSSDDLKNTFNKTAEDLLGYQPEDAIAQKFVKSYHQMEKNEGRQKSAGGTYVEAPTPSIAAKKQILRQFAPEAKNFAASRLAQIMDETIKGLG